MVPCSASFILRFHWTKICLGHQLLDLIMLINKELALESLNNMHADNPAINYVQHT